MVRPSGERIGEPPNAPVGSGVGPGQGARGPRGPSARGLLHRLTASPLERGERLVEVVDLLHLQPPPRRGDGVVVLVGRDQEQYGTLVDRGLGLLPHASDGADAAVEGYSGESALAYAARQMEFGPRPITSDANAELEAWLIGELQAADWRAAVQPYVAQVPVSAVGSGWPCMERGTSKP